jgi:hypothetical protein
MLKSLLQKHCSDESLLAHLDGELSLRRERAVKRHLATCWDCRARLAELEQQAESVTRSLAEQRFPGSHHIEGAKRRFLEAREEFERGLRVPHEIDHGLSFATRLSFAIALVVLTVVAVALWRSSRKPDLGPREVLLRTQSFEAAQTRDAPAVHQFFRVEISPIEPALPVSVRHLDVWSESSGGRFAARWTNESGTLENAVWHPNPKQKYIYSSGASLRLLPQSISDLPELTLEEIAGSGVSPEQLQNGFMSWLESQHWRPVSLASGMAVFAGERGVLLRADRIESADGRTLIRVRAERESQGPKVEVTMDVDPASYRPLVQTIRFETRDRVVEMKIVALETERLRADQIHAGLFEPDSDLMSSVIPRTPHSHKTAAVELSPAELAALEVDVLHHLDQIGAVLGEQASVSRAGKGRLLVQAIVDTDQRKEALLEALSDFNGNQAVELRIRTMAEATAADVGARKNQSTAGRVILRELEITREPTPVFAELRQLFMESQQSKRMNDQPNPEPSGPDKQDDQIRRFAKKSLDESQQALLHAWALKHFIERFSPDELKAMSPEAQAKWRSLIREHAEGFRRETEALRLDLQPVFYRNAPTTKRQGDDEKRSTALSDVAGGKGAADLEGADLDKAIDQLFAMASAHDEALRSAFVISAQVQSLDKIKSPYFLQSLQESEALAERIMGKSKGGD